ncbi:MAG: hypothetical protein ACRD9S_24345 [Pyrinomonadaceae bacterium]
MPESHPNDQLTPTTELDQKTPGVSGHGGVWPNPRADCRTAAPATTDGSRFIHAADFRQIATCGSAAALGRNNLKLFTGSAGVSPARSGVSSDWSRRHSSFADSRALRSLAAGRTRSQ